MKLTWHKTITIFVVFLLTSCATSTIVVKTEKNYNEKKVSSETLYEYGPTNYLRSEYGKNSSLTESKIDKIASEMKLQKMYFADSANSADLQGQLVASAGDEVTVLAKIYIVPIGDFFKIETPQGQFLVKDNEQQKLLSRENYQNIQLKNVVTNEELTTSLKSAEKTYIDYFHSTSEEERIKKITWFCSTYSKYKKFQSNAEKKQLIIGMPEHLLGLSWGKPVRVTEEVNTSGTYRLFYYPGNYIVMTRNTLITSWKKIE